MVFDLSGWDALVEQNPRTQSGGIRKHVRRVQERKHFRWPLGFREPGSENRKSEPGIAGYPQLRLCHGRSRQAGRAQDPPQRSLPSGTVDYRLMKGLRYPSIDLQTSYETECTLIVKNIDKIVHKLEPFLVSLRRGGGGGVNQGNSSLDSMLKLVNTNLSMI